MVSDEMLLKTMIRTYAYMRRKPSGAPEDGELMSLKTKGFGTVLDILSEQDGATQAQLTQMAQMRQQSMSEALSGLERRGYIRREPSESDRRVWQIFITEEGRQMQQQLKLQRQQLARGFFGPLSQEEKEELYRIFCKLGKEYD